MRVYFHGQKLESKCQLVTLKTHFLNVSIKVFPRENSLNVLVFPKGRVHPPPLQFINGQGHVHPPPLYPPSAVYQQTRACPFPHFCTFPYSLSIDRGVSIPTSVHSPTVYEWTRIALLPGVHENQKDHIHTHEWSEYLCLPPKLTQRNWNHKARVSREVTIVVYMDYQLDKN